jgi:hypothetical protein
MKKIITFLFASIFFTSLFAQYRNDDNNKNDDQQYGRGNNNNKTGIYNNQNSALIVNSASQNRFVVNIDNNSDYQSNENNGNGNTVNVGALQAGNHTITIYEVKKGFFGNQKQQQIYNSVLYFKPSTETSININFNGQVSVNEKPLFNSGGYGSNGSSCSPGNNGNGRGYGYGRKKNKNRGNGRYSSYDDDRYPNNYPNSYSGNNIQISNYDFGMLKQYVQNEAFDDRRINIAKQASGNSYFSTTQVRDLMGIFSFDDGKLDVAKYLYSRTVDRNNYYLLTDALSFSTNKDALLAFIRR